MRNNPMTAKKFADLLAIFLIVLMLFGLFGITGIFSSITSLGDLSPEVTVFSDGEYSKLDIDVASSDITILSGEKLSIECNKSCFRIKRKGDKISIEEKGGIYSLNRNRKIEITVPEDFLFERVEIDSGASDINGDSIKAKQLELDIGAGSVKFENLLVNDKTEIDCAAGEFSLKSGSLANLDFSLGIGNAKLTSAITSDSSIESGVGELELSLKGDKADYTLGVETGIGVFTVDSQRVRGESTIGNGETKIDIKGGVGNVTVNFVK